MLSKNVIRSMKTDIKNKREKAADLMSNARVLMLQAEQLEEYLLQNSDVERENFITGVVISDNPAVEPKTIIGQRLPQHQAKG